MSSADSRPEVVEGTPKLPETTQPAENLHENSNLHCESEDAHNREDGRLLADCVNQFKFGV